MTKALALMFLTAAGSAMAGTAYHGPGWPSGVRDANDPRLTKFYAAQCDAWASANKLRAKARSDYAAWCVERMPKVITVGTLESSGGGE